MALVGTLFDNFDNNSIDTALWNATSTVNTTLNEINKRIEIIASSGSSDSAYLESDITYDLASSSVHTSIISNSASFDEIVQLTLLSTSGLLSSGTEPGLYFYIINGDLIASWNSGVSETNVATLTYNSTNHKWLRIRESGGTIYWEVASDEQMISGNWQSFGSTLVSNLTGFTINTLYAAISFINFGISVGSITYFDNFNTYPTDQVKTTKLLLMNCG